MRTLLLITGLALGGLAAGHAKAAAPDNFEVRSTSDLVAICSEDQHDQVSAAATGFCHGYVVGVFRIIERVQQARPSVRIFCMPPSPPNRTQAIGAFVDWAKVRPDELDKQPTEGIADFLAATYPCPGGQPGGKPQERAMNRIGAIVVMLATAGTLPGCAGLNNTEQRALTGTGIGAAGGAVLGAIGGNAGLGALAGAGAGLAGGLLFDNVRKNENSAYREGYAAGRAGR